MSLSAPPPILKRKGSLRDPPEHITWDEKTLAEQEEERITNPKQKIEEPDTPFAYGAPEDDCESPKHQEEASNVDLQARMLLVGSALEQSNQPKASTDDKHIVSSSTSSDFSAKRRAIYADEGKRFKELLKGQPAEEEED
eukprot:NODE_6488_length_530_cov_23.066998_g6323_i0.p1 GENE.NODE_6488_length_530_cov_23.066998_g6323_i0~~NODE_6488_length_530_cov_23.066998_g6323_i0.p1  ORF type:complete len:157 (+),score=55.88 NODE_6488_length_530_cov_23.066998_g6323_i0:53-472(+)